MTIKFGTINFLSCVFCQKGKKNRTSVAHFADVGELMLLSISNDSVASQVNNLKTENYLQIVEQTSDFLRKMQKNQKNISICQNLKIHHEYKDKPTYLQVNTLIYL